MNNPGAEWGYLAPARDFNRMASLLLIAGAIGATAGAGVIFSLLDRPATETSLATSALSRPLEPASVHPGAPSQRKQTDAASAAPAHAVRVTSQTTMPEQLPPLALNGYQAPAASEFESSSPTLQSGNSAASPELAAATHDAPAKTAAAPAAADSTPATEAGQTEKKATKKPAVLSHYAWRGGYFRDGGRWGGYYEDRGWRSRRFW
jgi:hypothetical protein